MLENPKNQYNKSAFTSGNYRIEVAHKSPKIPEINPGTEAILSDSQGNDIFVAVAHDTLQIEKIGSKQIKVHINGKTLTEKKQEDVLNKHNYEVVVENPAQIAKSLEDSLFTISQISERLAYNPVEYLRKILNIDPLGYVEESDLQIGGSEISYDPKALTLSLLKILGYYRVDENPNIMGEPYPSKKTENIKSDTIRIQELAGKIPKSSFIGLHNLFGNMRLLKSQTYKAQSVDEIVQISKKPKNQRIGVLIEDLQHPIELIACVIYDKFGNKAVHEFLTKYFLEDYKKEKAEAGDLAHEAQMLTHLSLGRTEGTIIERMMTEVSAFVAEYADAEKKFTDKLTERIIKDNLSNINLFTSCLHPYEDLVLVDGNNLLPALAKITVSIEKSESGKEKRRYFLEGNEIKLDHELEPLSSDTKVNETLEKMRQEKVLANAIDALENLRKKGDFEGGRGFIYQSELTEKGKRVNFNKIFLFAKYGILPADILTGKIIKFTEQETKVATTLDKIVKSEFIFRYDEIPGNSYDLFYNGKKAGSIVLPENISPDSIQKMTIEQALSPDFPESEYCLQAYQLLRQLKNLKNEDILLGAIDLNELKFTPSNRKSYKVMKKKVSGMTGENESNPEPNEGFEDAGQISIDKSNKINILDNLSLAELNSCEVTETQRKDAIALNKIKFSDFEYVENGSVMILRKQSLDDFLEDFNAGLGNAAKYFDISAVRITDTANKKYFEAVLEKFLDDSKLDEKEILELIAQKEKLGANITNDDHRRLVIQAQYLSKKSLIDTILLPVAQMAVDGKLNIPEKFLYDIYQGVLKTTGVPEDLLNFLKTRTDSLIEEYEESRIPEERRLVRGIKEIIFKANETLEGNPNYKQLLGFLTDIIIAPKKKADEMQAVKERYSSGFMGEISKFLDELPPEGESIFADSFYSHFSTGKKDLMRRIKKLMDDEEVIENFGYVRFLIDTFSEGYEITPNDLIKYSQGMAKLPTELVARSISNMRSWCESQVKRETLEALTEKISIAEISETLKEKTVSKVNEGLTEDSEADIVFDVLQGRLDKLKSKYKIEPKKSSFQEVSDEDIKDLFDLSGDDEF